MEVDAFAISALAIAVVKAATVPFRILAIGAMPLSLPRGGVKAAAPARAAAGLQPADASGRRHSEHRAALRPRLRAIPGPGCRELRVGTRPARLFICRRHRHVAVDPAELGRARMSLKAQTRGSPVMILGGKEGRMLESRTIPTAMRGGISTSHRDAGSALGQAITALRRGEPVLIRDNEISVLAIAAELVTEENLRRLREISAGSVSVVLMRRRGVALRLS